MSVLSTKLVANGNIKKNSKSESDLCQRALRFPASSSLITFQFQSLVVSLSDIMCFFTTRMPVIWHLKG